MHLRKKGDLALSTNAIVVLIIAVIILGLIITFVTQGFGAVQKKFFDQVEAMPNPDTPTANKPITLSEISSGNPGDDFGLKIAVFNADSGPSTKVSPTIKCGSTADETIVTSKQQVNGQIIPGRATKTFVYVAKINSAATTGKQLCQVTIEGAAANTQLSSANADVVFIIGK